MSYVRYRWRVRHSFIYPGEWWIVYKLDNHCAMPGTARYFQTWRAAMDYVTGRWDT